MTTQTTFLYGDKNETPFRILSFLVADEIEWLSITVKTKDTRWFQFYVTDANGQVRMQYLGKHREEVLVLSSNTNTSTCGSTPGPLPAGTWNVHVSMYAVKEEQAQFELAICSGKAGESAPATTLYSVGPVMWAKCLDSNQPLSLDAYPWDDVKQVESRWYKGDFHMHTLLSDGKQTAEELTTQAMQRELDFIVITEHNMLTTGWPETDLLVIPGVEITSSKGHFNILGIREWIDLDGGQSLPDLETSHGIQKILTKSREVGAVCSLNHPALKPWHWNWPEIRIDGFDTIEIWNDPTFPTNPQATEEALAIWDLLWAEGQRLIGIGGSDTHALPHETYEVGGLPSVVGDPQTYVFAHQLSTQSIFESVRKGHVYVTRGPVLEPSVEFSGQTFLPGDELSLPVFSTSNDESQSYLYRLKIANVPSGAEIIWIEDGRIYERQTAVQSGEHVCEFKWTQGSYHWMRVEIRDESQNLLAFVNPVYAGKRNSQKQTWAEFQNE